MSLSARIYGEHDQRFHDDELGGGFGPGEYGEMIVGALMAGREDFVAPDRTHMYVNYALQMLRITGRTGAFYDYLQDDGFDPNVPTVNEDGSVHRLREAARELNVAASLEDVREEVAAEMRSEATRLFEQAARHDRTRPAPGVHAPLAYRYTLPKVKVRPRIGAEGIWYAKERNLFCFGGYEVSPKKLGRILALTLMRGDEWVVIGDDETEARCGYVYEVTVNYVVEMVREVGLYDGVFFDVDDETFDPNVPTHDGR